MYLTAEYTYLFNQITETIDELEALKNKLKSTQHAAEELYLGDELLPQSADRPQLIVS